MKQLVTISIQRMCSVFLAAIFVFPTISWPQDVSVLANLERDIQALLKLVEPSVVTVTAHLSYSYVESSEPNILGFWGAREEHQTIDYINVGSGIVFNDDGHILTKASIVENGHGITVTFSDGRKSPAEFLGMDRKTGLAVIKVDDANLHPARLGNSDQLEPGSWITIVGNSLGVSPAVSFGLVNSVRDDGLVQLCADVSPGNSGSPIFNVHGQVVGILAARVGGMPWSFAGSSTHYSGANAVAYPINQIRGLAADIARYGTRPEGWLGVTAEDWPGRPGWVHISGVFSSGPADKAGIRVGDLVTKLNNHRFRNSLELAEMVKKSLPGDVFVLDILRGSQKKKIKLAVEQSPEPAAQSKKHVLVPRQFTDSGVLTTEWQFNSDLPEAKEMTPEYLMSKIRQLENEIEILKSLVRSQKQ